MNIPISALVVSFAEWWTSSVLNQQVYAFQAKTWLYEVLSNSDVKGQQTAILVQPFSASFPKFKLFCTEKKFRFHFGNLHPTTYIIEGTLIVIYLKSVYLRTYSLQVSFIFLKRQSLYVYHQCDIYFIWYVLLSVCW